MNRYVYNEPSEALCLLNYSGEEVLEIFLHKCTAPHWKLLSIHRGAAFDACQRLGISILAFGSLQFISYCGHWRSLWAFSSITKTNSHSFTLLLKYSWCFCYLANWNFKSRSKIFNQ